MEGILTSLLGHRTLSPNQTRKLRHLSQTPPEYWTAKDRLLAGKARTQWLHEEHIRAHQGGSPEILDRIWPLGPYWPNGGVLVGGEPARKKFRADVGRMRYLDQERATAHERLFTVSPHDLMHLPSSHLAALYAEGDWTAGEPNQILNDRARARLAGLRDHPTSHLGRAPLRFSPREILRNGQFGAMVGAETEEDRYRKEGWTLEEGPFYGRGGRGQKGHYGAAGVVGGGNGGKEFEAGNGLGRPGWERERERRGGVNW